ncbi:MAG: hypothetical protein QMC83_01785 [Thermodesulfovibrionales bacterium]|nr:hypothetical protein [Thermodesulfovibrionales bacterium]
MKSKTTKASGYSTGRGTRVRHSTAMDWDELLKKRRIYPVKYSTGEDGQVVHSTGKEFDEMAKFRRREYEDNKPRPCAQGRGKPGGARHPGFTYKYYRKKDKSQSENDTKVSGKSFKKVIIDY